MKPRTIQFTLRQFEFYQGNVAYLLQHGMELAGYTPFGRGFPGPQGTVDVRAVCEMLKPDIVFFEGINCWDPSMPQPPSTDVGFQNYEWLGRQERIFRVTNYEDPCSHQDEHRQWHEVLQPHAVLIRYEPQNILRHNRWLAPDRLLRIYHSVTREYVPEIGDRRKTAILAGTRHERIYPMRTRLWREISAADPGAPGDVFTLRPHPGARRTGGPTAPAFMRALAEHRVAVVGSATYGWALKKHFEATAAGCIVVTDLPASDRIPIIEENLIRVPSDVSLRDLTDLVRGLAAAWDLEKQRELARQCVERYDYRVEARRFTTELERRWELWRGPQGPRAGEMP